MFRNENVFKKNVGDIYILKRTLLFTQEGQSFVEDFEHQNHTQQKIAPGKNKTSSKEFGCAVQSNDEILSRRNGIVE